MFGSSSSRKRRNSQDEDNKETPAHGEGMRVPELLTRRRSSIHPAVSGLQAASSSIAGPEGSTAASTPSSAPPLTLRRSSLAPVPPQQDAFSTTPLTASQARRSSVILGRIGEGSGAGLNERRGSALGAGLLGAARDVISPFRAPAHSALRLDTAAAARYPPSKQVSPRDPLLRMDKNDIRRPSFAQTMAATGESLVKTRNTPRTLRKTLLRLALSLFCVYVFIKLLANVASSFEEEEEDHYPHIQLPPSFTSLMQRQPSPSNRPTAPHPPIAREPLLSGADMRAFRLEKLWGLREDPVETVVIKPAQGHHHDSTIIFLHGLLQYAGDSPLAQHLPGRFPSTRWVMPQGPKKPVTVQDGKVVPAWFDILGFPYDNSVDEDPKNLYQSARLISTIINSERDELITALRERGGLDALPEPQKLKRVDGDEEVEEGEMGTRAEKVWASSRIILSGFSQGSVMTLLTGLTTRHRLAGLIAMSSFMPLRRTLRSLAVDLDRTSLPIFWGHGDVDEYLTLDDATHSVELLRATKPDAEGQGGLGLTELDYHVYPYMGHTYCGDELDHIDAFIRRVLPW